MKLQKVKFVLPLPKYLTNCSLSSSELAKLLVSRRTNIVNIQKGGVSHASYPNTVLAESGNDPIK